MKDDEIGHVFTNTATSILALLGITGMIGSFYYYDYSSFYAWAACTILFICNSMLWHKLIKELRSS